MPQYTLNIDGSLLDRIRREVERRAPEDGDPMSMEEGIAFLCDYALRRIAVLAKHAGKVKKVKRAIKAGAPLPEVEFKRYVPIFKRAALDAEGTPREVAKWTHAAPENTSAEIVAKPPRIRKAKRAPVARIESVTQGNAEVAASV